MKKRNVIHLIYGAVILLLLYLGFSMRQQWNIQKQAHESTAQRLTAQADSLLLVSKEKDRRIEDREKLIGALHLLVSGQPEAARAAFDQLAASGEFSTALLEQGGLVKGQYLLEQQNARAFQFKILQLNRAMGENKVELETTERELEMSKQLAQQQIEKDAHHFDSLSAVFFSLLDTLHETRSILKEAQEAIPEALIFKNGKKLEISYLGNIEDNMAKGKGIGFWETGSVYRGDWKNNQRHGRGIFEWKDGERYEGDFVEDRREGTGIYFWANGERYEGGWKNDNREGIGVIYAKDGKIKVHALWENDKLVRDLSVEN